MKNKMNNKGMTLVELLITFSLLMVVVVGMFNLILDIKLDLDDKQIVKNFTDFSNYYARTINQTLISKQPFLIVILEDEESKTCSYNNASPCDATSWTNLTYYCKDGLKDCSHTPKEDYTEVHSQSFKRLCSRIYPCAVYAYYENKTKGAIVVGAIAINIPSMADEESVTETPSEGGSGEGTTPTSTPLNKSDYGIGINYALGSKNVYERLPNQENAYISLSANDSIMSFGFGSESEGEEEGSGVTANTFVINFPLYKTGGKVNYGFRVVYPFITGQN